VNFLPSVATGPDFFDFIAIDECHRGGANDESNWRGIMEYFEPAVQLGLTATPKRRDNADTYAYFGEPVCIYSLKEGTNDGFLTPFKVKQVSTTIDEYVYTSDDTVIEGEIEALLAHRAQVESSNKEDLEDLTQVEQKLRLSHNLLAPLADKCGPRFRGNYRGDPNDAKLEPIFRFH